MERQKVMALMDKPGGGGGGGGENQSNGAPSGDIDAIVGEIIEVIETIGSYIGFRKTQKKESLNMVRRLKLLMPLLEEIRELEDANKSLALNCLCNLKKALFAAKKLLKTCNLGSKLYLVTYLIAFNSLCCYIDC